MLKAAHVIKGNGGDTAQAPTFSVAMNAAQLVKRVVLDAQDEAARLLAAAEEQAASIVATAEKRAEHALLDAERRGLEQGLAQAAARALHIAKDAARVDTHALPRVIEIARMLSERMLGRAIELQPALLGELAFAALKEARAGHAVQFRCHPADVPVIEAAFTSTGLGTTAVDVVADPELGSGDFKLRSAAGVLEASLGGRLDLLCRALLEAPRA